MASLQLDNNDDDDDSDGVVSQRRNQVSQEREDLVVKGEAFLCTWFWAFLLIVAVISARENKYRVLSHDVIKFLNPNLKSHQSFYHPHA